MQFKIRVTGTAPDPATVERALQAIDPAAMVDFDSTGGTLRLATMLDEDTLVAALGRAGLATEPRALERVPSECCGGCGG